MINLMHDRYGLLVYNGSVHYWRISRILQREGLRAHVLPSEQIVVDAVRKLPDKQELLSSLLLQLALGQLEVSSSSLARRPLPSQLSQHCLGISVVR